MSDLLPSADVVDCPPYQALTPVIEAYPAREAALPGGLIVRRALPRAGRRMVGPWCFLDHYGPLSFGAGKPMDIGPHPHIGLQTVTWLIEGEALHHDSLGHERLIRPGQLNLMTAGSGISHAEPQLGKTTRGAAVGGAPGRAPARPAGLRPLCRASRRRDRQRARRRADG